MNGDFDSFSSEPSYTSPEAYSRARARTTRPSESLQLAYRLVWVVVILAAILFGPTVIRRFQYANTYGIEKAKVDVALEGLGQLDKLNLQGLEAASRLVAQRVGPGVVHIRTARVGGGGGPVDERQFLFGLPQPRKQTLGQGSGVVMDESGFIVTNNHVIDGATGILVQLSDGSSVPAKVIGTDPLTDLAVLKINSPDLIAMPWGDSDQLEVGDLVWAVGSPFGLDRSVTFGIVSAKNRRGVTASPYQSFLQSDAAVNPGNSGGPLVNIRGEVVGINTAIVGESYQGISFAIPATTAEEVYQRIKSTGKVARGWLGVALQEVDEEIAREAGLDEPRGVRVAPRMVDQRGNVVTDQFNRPVPGVLPDSPAAEAGIRPGDIILSWNGKAAQDRGTLSRMVASTDVGSVAKVRIWRDGEEILLNVKVGERPPEY